MRSTTATTGRWNTRCTTLSPSLHCSLSPFTGWTAPDDKPRRFTGFEAEEGHQTFHAERIKRPFPPGGRGPRLPKRWPPLAKDAPNDGDAFRAPSSRIRRIPIAPPLANYGLLGPHQPGRIGFEWPSSESRDFRLLRFNRGLSLRRSKTGKQISAGLVIPSPCGTGGPEGPTWREIPDHSGHPVRFHLPLPGRTPSGMGCKTG